jgi:hypothetical protein
VRKLSIPTNQSFSHWMTGSLRRYRLFARNYHLADIFSKVLALRGLAAGSHTLFGQTPSRASRNSISHASFMQEAYVEKARTAVFPIRFLRQKT